MSIRRRDINIRLVPKFVSLCIKLNDFDCVTYQDGLFNLYFKEEKDTTVDYSRYHTIVVSEITGLITMYED